MTQFSALDKDQDGRISYKELLQGINSFLNLDKKSAKKKAENVFKNLGKEIKDCIDFY